MKIGGETLGPLGATLLSLTAVSAAGLGAFGALSNSPETSGLNVAALSTGGTSTTSGHKDARHGAKATSASAASPKAAKAAPAVRLGPLLSSMPYAGFATQIFPGKLTNAGALATTGFHITASISKGVMTIRFSLLSGGSPVVRQYPTATKLYFIETQLSDDSPPSGEYSFGDDGLQATNAQGRIVL